MSKNSFTEKEIQEVEKMATTNSVEEIARSFNMSLYQFTKLRKAQAELDWAYRKGAFSRKEGSSFQRRSRNRLPREEKPQKFQTKELSSEEALASFKKQFEENKRKRIIRELRNYY